MLRRLEEKGKTVSFSGAGFFMEMPLNWRSSSWTGPSAERITSGNCCDHLGRGTCHHLLAHCTHASGDHRVLAPILCIIPGQLLAALLAGAKGFDPDSPRSLAKVTRTLWDDGGSGELWPHDAGHFVVHADHRAQHFSSAERCTTRISDGGLPQPRESKPRGPVILIHPQCAVRDSKHSTHELACSRTCAASFGSY